MRRSTATLAALVAVVAGCSTPATPVDLPAGTSTPPGTTAVAAAPSRTAAGPRRPSRGAEEAFVAAFARQWPRLAAGRTRKGIGNDLDNYCGDIARGEDAAVAARRMGDRLATATSAPDAATVAAVVEVARAHCR